MKTTNILLLIFVILVVCSINGQLLDRCNLDNGSQGKCLFLEDCPSALELVRDKKQQPPRCGFQGTTPIICCETQEKPLIGEITRQKCKEIYSGLIGDMPIFVGSAAHSRRKREEETTPSISVGEQPASVDQEPILNITLAVVGGYDSPAKEFPHMALLGYGEYPNVNWACGGSLISDKFVLSAAHCINPKIGPVQYIRLGELDLNSTDDIADPKDFKIRRVIRHPLYKPPSVYHDIALIELETPAVYSDFIRPACLHTERQILNPVWIATGWGATSFGGSAASYLQQVTLKESSHADCQNAFEQTSKRRLKKGIDDDTQMCAGELEKDTCQGDSGGPLQIRNEYSVGYQVIGVTSFGVACGIGNKPAVYTRVSYYIDWIESIVWS